MLPVIVLGDATDHGGVVLSASPGSETEGRPMARVGDLVGCPTCMGVYAIAEGDTTWLDEGQPVAYHGCKTTCGASLISSQTLIGRRASGPSRAAAGVLGGAGRGTMVSYQPWAGAALVDDTAQSSTAQPANASGPFRGRFRLVQAATGEPIGGHPFTVSYAGGEPIQGQTDDDGYTPWVETAQLVALHFTTRGA
ncbi:putative Zn-binding protein involved in type VI secretion [Chitinivorax tropicus]|uniref:Putative Zn-binding protein involved in type VI secretion n=1 Tax=Chitinivorax tropicus TaxID=714531 RepID=A0A840MU72_9PROT|nr:PAAR domain-containing protein [Chitinivorax tropicus]MBB5018721.1 putative Zn-binding protein involved in type VI secretion [Chitinivorax tropicus]